MVWRIALVSFEPKLGDVLWNMEKHGEICNKLKKEVDFIFFPELSLCGYLLENLAHEIALEKKSPLWQKYFKDFSNSIFLGSVLYEEGHFYNAYLGLEKGEIVFLHKKIYLPTYGMFDEGRYFSCGQVLNYFNYQNERIGILLCEDAWHPVLAYAHYIHQCSLVVVPSASPLRSFMQNEAANLFSYRSRLYCYSESYNQFYAYVNRGGVDDGVFFPPDSFVVSPLKGFLNGEKGEFEGITYQIFTLNFLDIKASATRGGPWQNDIFSLNISLLKKAWEKNEKH